MVRAILCRVVNVWLHVCSSVGRRPVRDVFVNRTPPSSADTVARSPPVVRHTAGGVRRAPSFRPEDISTPTLQSSTNSLLHAAAAAASAAGVHVVERATPPLPTRLAPPPPGPSTLRSSSFEGLHSAGSSAGVNGPRRTADQPDASSLSSSSFGSADEADCVVRWRPPRPRHALNKVARAESLRQQQQQQPSAEHHPSCAVASVVASLRDRFEARRAAASSDLPDPDASTPEMSSGVAGKPDVPPKPGNDEGLVVRRARALQRQPAFREFDVTSASQSSGDQLARVT